MLDAVWGLIQAWIGNLIGDGITFQAMCGHVDANTLTSNVSVQTGIGKVITDGFVVIAYGLLFVYFFIELNQKVAMEGFNSSGMRVILSPCCKLLIGLAILSNGESIVEGLISVNNALISGIQSTIESSASTIQFGDYLSAVTYSDYGEFAKLLRQLGILQLLIIALIAVIGLILRWIIQLIWWYKGCVYNIEYILRASFFPLAFAEVYNGNSSNAWRYMKGFIAFGIYGGLLVALPTLTGIVCASDLNQALVTSVTSSDQYVILGAVLDVLIQIIKLTFVAPFIALSCTNLARTAVREALS